MNLLFQGLLLDLTDLARSKGIERFRIDHRRNAHGELVVAIVIQDADGPFGPEKIDPKPRRRDER